MNIAHLPDDILVNIFAHYLNLADLESAYSTCNRFKMIIDGYDLWHNHLYKTPLIDYNYPFGFSDFSHRNNKYTSRDRLRIGFRWTNGLCKRKLFYSFNTKMLPHIQLDEFGSAPVLYTTDGGSLIGIDFNSIKPYVPTKHQQRLINQKDFMIKSAHNKKVVQGNKIQIVNSLKIFNDDIKSFMKKDDMVASISNQRLRLQAVVSWEMGLVDNVLDIEENDYGNKINCVDFSAQNNKLVYGCSDGFIKVHDIKTENLFANIPVAKKRLHERVLRCVYSPSLCYVAVGTAAVKPDSFEDKIAPLHIFDSESLREVQKLLPRNKQDYKRGAGILALNYIDENTLMSSGYDTYIRIFDLRSNRCILELEDPEDISIYCVCVSKFYGLLSGSSRQSLIRYWDRRKARLVASFTASSNNSSIYSLATTPEAVYAAWDHGLTTIDFN